MRHFTGRVMSHMNKSCPTSLSVLVSSGSSRLDFLKPVHHTYERATSHVFVAVGVAVGVATVLQWGLQ